MAEDRKVVPVEVIEDPDFNWKKTLSLLKLPELKDCLSKDHRPQLPSRVNMDLTQNDFTKLKQLWSKVGPSGQRRFKELYGDIALLLYVKVEEKLIKGALYFWDPSYRCFTFGRHEEDSTEGKYDMVPTVEEYGDMLMIKKKLDKVFWPWVQHPKILAKMMEVDLEELRRHMDGDYVQANLLMNFVDKNYQTEKGLDILALLIMDWFFFLNGYNMCIVRCYLFLLA